MATFDRRTRGNAPVWEHSITQMTWATGAGHAAQTETVPINGIIKEIVFDVSEVTGDPDVVFSIQDADGNEFYTVTTNDGTTTKNYVTTHFAEGQLSFAKGFIVSADPSADAGGAAQTLTVDVILRGI